MYREARQMSLERPKRICPACKALDPPTQPGYGCQECGQAFSLSELGGQVPNACPNCEAEGLECITDEVCAQCGQAEVEERQVYTCPYCGHISLSRYDHYTCPNKPARETPPAPERPDWTPGGVGKVAYLRLECRAREERPKVNNKRCKGWQHKVERFLAGDGDAFAECLLGCFWGGSRNPARVDVERIEPHVHQKPLKLA